MSSPPATRRPRARWAAATLLREAVLRLHHAYEDLPAELRRRWWTALAIGFVGAELFALGMVWIGKRLDASGVLRWEPGALLWIEANAPISFNTAMWLEGVGNGFVLWAVMLIAGGVAAWQRRPLVCLSFLVGYTCVYLVIATAWVAWDRPRPTLIAEGIGTPGGFFHSYPSGHMVQAVFAYGLLVALWWRAAAGPGERVFAGLVWLVLVSAVAAGRLRIGAHWPSDVVAGLLIGLVWTAGVVLALRRALAAAPVSPPSAAP